MTTKLTDRVADDGGVPIQTQTGKHDCAESLPVAGAMPWDEDAWALLLPPGADLASLAVAVGQLPAGCQFVETYGDVETVLVFRFAEPQNAESLPPDAHTTADGTELRPPANAHPLALIRAARGWSYEAMSRRLAAKARTVGVNMAADRQKIWRWEHHGVTPHRATQMILADLLDVPRGLVDARPWPAWIPTDQAPEYHRIVEDLTEEVEKGLRAIAALGYTLDGSLLPRQIGRAPA